MQSIKHPIVHQFQPTHSTCSPTALSMLLSTYNKTVTVDELSSSIPQMKNEKGEDAGTINQQMATYCLGLGFDVTLYTFDCQIIDQSWQDLPEADVQQRLQAAKDGWEVPSLGALWSNAYRQSYIDFLEAGGDLQIRQYVTTELLYMLLKNGPVLPCLCFNTLYGVGRTVDFDDDDEKIDAANGRAWNHSVVIYGYDDGGNFLITDPWRKPGLVAVEPEAMLAAISTAQIECDNLLFQINLKD